MALILSFSENFGLGQILFGWDKNFLKNFVLGQNFSEIFCPRTKIFILGHYFSRAKIPVTESHSYFLGSNVSIWLSDAILSRLVASCSILTRLVSQASRTAFFPFYIGLGKKGSGDTPLTDLFCSFKLFWNSN